MLVQMDKTSLKLSRHTRVNLCIDVKGLVAGVDRTISVGRLAQ